MTEGLQVVVHGAGPSVVLSAGLGLCWFDWDAVTDLLSVEHRVVRFDRPGLGGSRPEGLPTLHREADRLARLIVALQLTRPVLVAHSVAAFHAEACARLHPDLLGGLVLVDPSCERGRTWSLPAAILQRSARVLTSGARALDRGHLAEHLGPVVRRALVRGQTRDRRDPASAAEVAACYGSADALGAILAEYLLYRPMDQQLHRLRRSRPFPALPLTVLTATAGMSARAARRWRRCHRSLAALSPAGAVVELPDSAHLVQFDRPDAIAAAVAGMTRPERRAATT